MVKAPDETEVTQHVMPYLLLQLWAAACGTRDGRLLIPHAEDPSPWISSCLEGGKVRAAAVKGNHARSMRRLAAKRDAIALAAAQARELAGRNEAAEARCAEQREALLLQAEDLRRDQGTLMGHGLPTWGYALAVAALCSLEFPLVYLSFGTFGLEPVYTFLLSALCAVLTGFLGHAAGTLSRHLRVSARLVLGLILLGSVAFIGSLAFLRESAMAALSSATLTLNPAAATWALFAISCATMVAAALLAWHHRVEPLAHEIARATRTLNGARRAAARARARLLRLGQREQRAARRLEAAAALVDHRLEALRHRTRRLMHTYASANLRARDDNRLPPSLRDEQLPWFELAADKE